MTTHLRDATHLDATVRIHVRGTTDDLRIQVDTSHGRVDARMAVVDALSANMSLQPAEHYTTPGGTQQYGTPLWAGSPAVYTPLGGAS